MSDLAGRLLRIHRSRSRPEPDWSIGGLVEATAAEAQRHQVKLGELTDLWNESLPPDLARRTKLITIRGGVLNVAVESSSTMYELDRLLREGLEATLRAQFRGSLSRIRLSTGFVDDAKESEPQRRRGAQKKYETTDEHG